MITDNNREGLMHKSKKFMKEFKQYKKHSDYLRAVQKEFEEEGHKFKNIEDVRNIILLLKLNDIDESFSDADDSSKDRDIFNNSFFKR